MAPPAAPATTGSPPSESRTPLSLVAHYTAASPEPSPAPARETSPSPAMAAVPLALASAAEASHSAAATWAVARALLGCLLDASR